MKQYLKGYFSVSEVRFMRHLSTLRIFATRDVVHVRLFLEKHLRVAVLKLGYTLLLVGSILLQNLANLFAKLKFYFSLM